MRAIVNQRYGPADALVLADVDKPAVGADQVLVRIRAAAANPLDWHFMKGEPYIARLQLGLRRPKRNVLGNDMAGEVESVGESVTRFRPGDAVFGDVSGSFAEYVSAAEDLLESKPSNLTFEQAAAVPVAGITALQGLRDHGRLQAGQKVLIIGAAGGVGTFAVQLAKEFGAEVTGVCSTGKVDLVRSIGADDVIDYTRQDFTRSNRRYDLIFQLAGTASASALRRVLTPKGTLLLSSGESPGRWIGPIWRIVGAMLSSPLVSQRLRPFEAKRSRQDLTILKGFIEAGKIRPIIDRTYPLAQVPDAVRYVEAGHAGGKVVITI